MMELIKQLEHAGNVAELRRLVETMPAGDELARALIALSKLQEDAARSGAEYHQALAFAQQAVTAAVPGNLMETWALGRTAALAADLGQDTLACRASSAFMAQLESNPGAEVLAPWVWASLARVRARQGHYAAAVTLWRRVISAAGGELAERAQLHLVWTLAEAERSREAADVLPSSVQFVSVGHLSAARAVVAASAGDWPGARLQARIAIRHHAAGEWAIYDTRQAAELCLILKRAAQVMGQAAEAAVWALHSAALIAGWDAGIMSDLLQSLRPEGGAHLHAAASHRGPAGHHRCGLRGVVG
jgi:hypothetical protein